jgi:hypothetical protein
MVTGFRKSKKGYLTRIKRGDVLLCYLTGVMRWVGALEVIGPSQNTDQIWTQDQFPVRFDVRPLVILDPEHGVPMEELQGKVYFYASEKHQGKFQGFLRMSPNFVREPEDGKLILDLISKAKKSPVFRQVDPKKLAYKPFYVADRKKGKAIVSTRVSVPEPESDPVLVSHSTSDQELSQHTEIQALLLTLGSEMGFDIWVARNDRSKVVGGAKFAEFPGAVETLPTQFNEATTATIEFIDVLWLKGNSIEAAFEVESTTSIYSGLLRMSDLISLQPNLEIRLFLVAPDSRRDKVQQELLRPTFNLRDKPLASICGFIPFSVLREKVNGIQALGLAKSLKPDFLQTIAEYFGDETLN